MAHKLQVGINYPWLDYGWDFGDPPAAWVGPQYAAEWREKKRRQIAEDFRRFATMGLVAVRWFVLCDGLSYGTGNEAPKEQGGKWTFDPLPRDHAFHRQLLEDFEYVLKVCAETGIKFVPSLLDFHWCHIGSVADAASGIVKGGRYEVLLDKAKSEAFFDAVLEPLLDVSVKYRDSIYAWELFNEPEWIVDTRGWLKVLTSQNRTIPLADMRGFLSAGLRRINARDAFPSSVGFAHWDAIGEWNAAELGVTLHQFHYYAPDLRRIPGHHYPPENQCFIGEFATKYHRGWPEMAKGDLARTITARLKLLEEKGYPAAFLWSARAQDEATTWTSADQEETVAFIELAGSDVA